LLARRRSRRCLRARRRRAPPPSAGGRADDAGGRIVTGQAPVGRRQRGGRARARAGRRAEAGGHQALATIVDPEARAAQAKTMKALEAKARSFVPRYRTLEEGEANGIYTVRLEAEVDETALRRRLEKGSTAASPPVTPVKTGAPGMLVAAADKGEGTAAFVASLVSALASANVRARRPTPERRASPPPPRPRRGRRWKQAALVTAEMVPEGMVRGTGRVAISCRANVRLVTAPAGGNVAERAATARVFVEAEKAADGAAQCRTQLGADLAGRLAGAAASGARGRARRRPALRDRRRRRRPSRRRSRAGQKPARRRARLRGRADARRPPGRAEIRVRTRRRARAPSRGPLAIGAA
jgi:hypothetical protein